MFTESLSELVSSWDAYRAKRLVDSEDRVFKIVTSEIPEFIKNWTPNPGRYKFAGGTGMGNISGAPYFATFDLDITHGAKHGYYLVYLLSADLKRLVLEIGFGVYQFEDYFGASKKMYEALETAVKNMRVNTEHLVGRALVRTKERTNAVSVQLDNGKYRLLRGYEKSSIYSLTYEVGALPPEEELVADYLEYLYLYNLMSESLLLADVDAYVFESAGRDNSTLGDSRNAVEEPFVPRQFSKRKHSADSARGSSERRYSKKADKVGKLGEEVVVEFERLRLIEAGRQDLASRIIWHRNDPTNRTPGWDVTSFETSGVERLIEVKASDSREIKDVELTVNEWKQATLHAETGKYCIYIVAEVFRRPVIQIVRNPTKLVNDGTLAIEVARYSLALGVRER